VKRYDDLTTIIKKAASILRRRCPGRVGFQTINISIISDDSIPHLFGGCDGDLPLPSRCRVFFKLRICRHWRFPYTPKDFQLPFEDSAFSLAKMALMMAGVVYSGRLTLSR